MAKEILKIAGEERNADFGSAGSRRVLRSGRIPCVVYGQKAPLHFTVDAQEFARLRKKITKATPIDVVVGSHDMTCLLKAVQENFLTDKILHIDFYEINRNKEVEVSVKLVLTGTAKGVREGGVLEQIMHEVQVVCLPRDLPEEIIVDVSNLGANETLLLKDIPAIANVKFIQDEHSTVATVKFEKTEEAAPAPAAEPAPATAAPSNADAANKASGNEKK